MEVFSGLGIALFAGLLIGVERGWKQSAMPEETRVMGLRTFALIGLMGGFWGLLGEAWGPILPALGGIGLALLLGVTYWRSVSEQGDVGCTTEVAAMLTYALGVVAMAGYPTEAAAGAVATAILLEMKTRLHGLLDRLTADELRGTLMLLLISVAILPLLPNQGYGPFDALNPYLIWWMVVLIAGIQFAGYVAVRVAGSRYGILLTGMVAGLMASTPLALSFARLGRQQPWMVPTLACGILAASSMMFPRALVVATVIAPGLLKTLAWPLLAMMAVGILSAGWLWWRGRVAREPEFPVRNPFELWPAIRFGLLLAAIMLAVTAAREWLGDSGLYAVALISGLTDVDPVTLSFARLASNDQVWHVATNGIVIAAMANTLFKGGLVWVAGGRQMGWTITLPIVLILATGGAWLVSFGF